MAAKKTKGSGSSYTSAGVHIDDTDAFVDALPEITKETRDNRVLSTFKEFAGLYLLDMKGMEEPVLVTTTDGVGTKLRVAQLMKVHDTIGIDLVAMCANDLITCGAKPLVFLDYLATGSFQRADAQDVLKGIVEGCKQAGMVLIGGETAEMPGFYKKGDYDLAGFAAGMVDRRKIVDTKRIAPKDVVLGIRSSGLHSNGYSLARKILLENEGIKLSERPRGLGATLGEELLRPTRIYVSLVKNLLAQFDLKAIAHITGGGLPDNIRRLLPEGCHVRLHQESWEVPPIFRLIERRGKVSRANMYRTFNMGIGLVLIASPDQATRLRKVTGEEIIQIGRVEAGKVDVRVD